MICGSNLIVCRLIPVGGFGCFIELNGTYPDSYGFVRGYLPAAVSRIA